MRHLVGKLVLGEIPVAQHLGLAGTQAEHLEKRPAGIILPAVRATGRISLEQLLAARAVGAGSHLGCVLRYGNPALLLEGIVLAPQLVPELLGQG